jgi:fumarate reductase subunit D
MKRSHAPVFWLLFGAGGMLAALAGPALVFLTGLAGPAGWLPQLLAYDAVAALARHGAGKLLLFAVASLFAWHAAHRILCSLHDVGIRKGLAAKLACYGSAMAITLIAGGALLAVGF